MDNLLGGRDVDPVRTLAPYLGGKRNLARRIVRAIDAVPHDGYAEVFLGMGGIFFRRRHVPKVEVVNDLSSDVATLFRILQRHYVPFTEMLRYQVTSRREFERLAKTDPSTLTDLERAARFLYLQRTAYGGGSSTARSASIRLRRAPSTCAGSAPCSRRSTSASPASSSRTCPTPS